MERRRSCADDHNPEPASRPPEGRPRAQIITPRITPGFGTSTLGPSSHTKRGAGQLLPEKENTTSITEREQGLFPSQAAGPASNAGAVPNLQPSHQEGKKGEARVGMGCCDQWRMVQFAFSRPVGCTSDTTIGLKEGEMGAGEEDREMTPPLSDVEAGGATLCFAHTTTWPKDWEAREGKKNDPSSWSSRLPVESPPGVSTNGSRTGRQSAASEVVGHIFLS